MTQVAVGFSISSLIESGEVVLFQPLQESRSGSIIRYSGLLESIRAVISLPSLGPPGAFPEGFADLDPDDRSEAYRQWLHSQPRKLLEILIGEHVWARVPMINRLPWYEINLMAYLGDQSIARISPGQQLKMRLANAGFGVYSAGDSILIKGFGIQEAFIEDFAPQFSALDQSFSQQTGLINNRLSQIESRLNLIEPKIDSTNQQTLSDGQLLNQVASDLQWIRQNWGTGSSGGQGNTVVWPILASIGSCQDSTNLTWFKVRRLTDWNKRYRIRVSPSASIANQIQSGPKAIQIMAWSVEPNNSNFNQSWNCRWIADLPQSGGEFEFTTTTDWSYLGIKARRISTGFYDTAFTSEAQFSGLSAEWVLQIF